MNLPVQSTAWLLAHELRLTRRAMLARPGMKWRVPILVVAFLSGAVFLGGPAVFALRRMDTPSTPAFAGIVAIATAGIFTLMLSQCLAAATETLYARGDLDLLFSSPMPPRRVLFTRCAAIAANAFGTFALLVTPVAIPVALFARPTWLAVYGLLAALALVAASAGLGMAIGLFRLIGPKRTKSVSQLLAVFIGAAIFLVAQARNLVGPARFGRWTSGFALPGGLASDASGPLSWPWRVATGELAPLVIALAAAIAIFTLTTTLVGRRFAADAAAASGAATGGVSRRGGEGAFAGGAFRVVFHKETRLLGRDIPLLAQVLLRVVYLLPLTFVLLRNAGGHDALKVPVGVGAVVFLSGQVAGSLVWLTVAAEDAPDLIGCAPARAATIRRAKLCAALAPLAVLMTIPLIVLVAISPLAGAAAAAGCVAAALASALIGFSLQKPARRATFMRRGSGSLVAAIAEFGAGGVIASVAGFAVVWPPLLAASAVLAGGAAWALWRGDEPPRWRLPKRRGVVH